MPNLEKHEQALDFFNTREQWVVSAPKAEKQLFYRAVFVYKYKCAQAVVRLNLFLKINRRSYDYESRRKSTPVTIGKSGYQ